VGHERRQRLSLHLSRHLRWLGGPTGTGTGITDGGATWAYVGAASLLGTMTVDSEEADLFDPTDGAAKAGEGSELHLMAAGAFAKAPAARIKAIAQAESAGAFATGTITITVTATADGTLRSGSTGSRSISRSTRATPSGRRPRTSRRSSIRSPRSSMRRRPPPLASSRSTRATAVRAATSSASARRPTPRARPYALGAATLTGGTTADTLTNALTTAATSRHHYYALASVDQTALQAVQTQILTMAGPLVGKRQQFIAGSVDTFGNATTIAEALNEQRGQILWMPSGETLPCVMAAAWAAMRAIAEGVSISVNLSSYNPDVVDLWPVVVPQGADANYVTDSQAAAALDVGLTPIQVRGGDKHPFVPLSITTHSNDSSGNPDYRTLTTNYVTVTDAFADEFQSWAVSTFVDMKLRDDRQSGDDPLPANVTTPGVIKSMWKSRARDLFENLGHINNLDDDYARGRSTSLLAIPTG
jgi:phage tail sheath gpL-like